MVKLTIEEIAEILGLIDPYKYAIKVTTHSIMNLAESLSTRHLFETVLTEQRRTGKTTWAILRALQINLEGESACIICETQDNVYTILDLACAYTQQLIEARPDLAKALANAYIHAVAKDRSYKYTRGTGYVIIRDTRL